MTAPSPPASAADRTRAYALAFTLLFPTLLTYTYFVYLADNATALQQVVYTVGKLLQFAFPLLWVLCFHRQRLNWIGPSRRGIVSGVTFGLLMCAVIWGLYALVLQPSGLLDGPDQAVRDKLRDTGLNTLWKFIAAATFYALFHSLLEEYYWRWFVFGELRERLSIGPAIAISSLGFMAHHVIVLATFLGWQSPLTYLFALCIAIGGAAWAWMYHRSGSLYGPWLSHLLIDAVIFLVGYDLARAIL